MADRRRVAGQRCGTIPIRAGAAGLGSAMRRVALVLVCLAILPLAGCIILPLPPVGAQIGGEEIGSLQPGVSTRADLHDRLGEPSHSVMDRYEIFDVSEERAHVLFAFLFYAGGVERVGAQDFRVLAEYGSDDVLESLAWEARIAEDGAGYRYLSSRVPAVGSDEDGAAAPRARHVRGRSWSAPTEAHAVAASPEGSLVAITYDVGAKRAQITLRDWQTGTVLAQLAEAPAGCPGLFPRSVLDAFVSPALAFLSDGRHLAIGADEARVCIWDVETQRGVLTFDGHVQPRSFLGRAGTQLASMASARSVPIVATADTDNIVKVWDGLSGRELLALGPCASGPGCGSWVATSLGRPTLSSDGRLLAFYQAGSQGDAVRLWDTMSGDELATLTPSGKAKARFARLITSALSPDGQRLALHMGDHIQVWRLGRPVAFALERVFVMPPFAPDVPGTSIHQESSYYVRSLEFSADGRRLVAGGIAMIIAWDTGSWRQVWRTRLVRNEPFALVDNGQRLVTGRGVRGLPELIHGGSSPPAPSS